MSGQWFNLAAYSAAQHAWYVADTLFWVLAYVLIAIQGFRHRFVGIPVAALAANLAWELLFSFVFETDLGPFYVWGARGWLAFDIVLVYLVLQHGPAQVHHPWLKARFKAIFVAVTASWLAVLYAFISEFHDSIGGYSGYILNLQMSALYIWLLLQYPMQPALSRSVAWSKGLGTAFIGAAELCAAKPSRFVLTAFVVTLLLDGIYLGLLQVRQRLPKVVESVHADRV